MYYALDPAINSVDIKKRIYIGYRIYIQTISHTTYICISRYHMRIAGSIDEYLYIVQSNRFVAKIIHNKNTHLMYNFWLVLTTSSFIYLYIYVSIWTRILTS